ncbi:hypothetical protein AYJ59_12735 [Thiomicrospira sp. S5]|nr:hypothetical protein AYJ59_12735 [Thiomicrospira sp. S5]
MMTVHFIYAVLNLSFSFGRFIVFGMETKTNCQGTDKADTPLCLKKESEIIELKNKIASKNRI